MEENNKLEKEFQKLKDEGVRIPEKVKAAPGPKKKQVIGIKNSKVSSATKKELKKINELREKEEV